MCTLTWTTLPPTPGRAFDGGPGYQLWFNRDEQLTRAAELPPRVQVAENGVHYIAPEDSEAGGTWITVNEFGVTIALLNGYLESRGPERESYTSRGVLVRSLAGIQKVKEALDPLSPKKLRSFQPAVVFVKAPGEPALVVRWDGRDAAIDVNGERQLPLTSSGYEQDEVQQARKELYRVLVLDAAPHLDPLEPDPALLDAYHRYVDPSEGPTPFTPTMSHPRACTRSQCGIRVTARSVAFAYRPGPPHVTEVSVELELERVVE